ncbi:hypothetical protein [Helicobacter marmotae]|uniref:Uncharacterized protein n=1 Tax=Helicobacter marmotae TaxID=152490 RepID=A0A3D8I284_9HELI|nr:hypothetical protein [Helicobacter marmotae]RDU59250.1 hypothetical protein CQA63_07335 [Helicobacter marmotae]
MRKHKNIRIQSGGEESLSNLLEILLVCHSERSEESLLSTRDFLSKTLKSTTSDSDRDSSGFTSPQNDKLSYPQGKPTHNKHLQRKLLCHSKHCEETLPETPASPLFCHSERSEESLSNLPESPQRFFTPYQGFRMTKSPTHKIKLPCKGSHFVMSSGRAQARPKNLCLIHQKFSKFVMSRAKRRISKGITSRLQRFFA